MISYINTWIDYIISLTCTLLICSIGTLPELINISSFQFFLSEEEFNQSFSQLSIQLYLALLSFRILRNMCFVYKYWIDLSMIIWILAFLGQISIGIGLLIYLQKSVILILLQLFNIVIVTVVSHFIDLILLVPSDQRQLLFTKSQLYPTEEECFICNEPFVEYVELPCQHQLHKTCLEKWILYGRSTCPLCRDELV